MKLIDFKDMFAFIDVNEIVLKGCENFDTWRVYYETSTEWAGSLFLADDSYDNYELYDQSCPIGVFRTGERVIMKIYLKGEK